RDVATGPAARTSRGGWARCAAEGRRRAATSDPCPAGEARRDARAIDSLRRDPLGFARSEGRGSFMQHYRNYIDGQWAAAASGKTLAVIAPATRQVIARVPDSGPADVDRAVAAARRAFDVDGWPQTSARERGRVLFRIAEFVRRNEKRLAEIETTNNGKPLAEALGDVSDAGFCFEYYGGLATEIPGDRPTRPG